MRGATFVAACVLAVCGTASAQDFAPVGSFDNVRQSLATGEAHCYGYSLELWQYKGRMLGMLDRHAGLCGDPPCEALTDVSHDPKTGALTFSALGMSFNGRLRQNDVVGVLGGQRVRLGRSKDFPMDAERDRSVDAWCEFWRGVPRCRGITALCTSLGARKP